MSFGSINLLPLTGRHSRRWSVAAGASVLLAIGALVWLAHSWQERERALGRLAEWQRQIGMREESRLREQETQQKDAERLKELDRASQPWVRARMYPWNESFLEIERLAVPGLQVQRIRVTADQHLMELDVRAPDVETVMRTAEHLNGSLRDDAPRAWQVVRIQRVKEAAGAEAVLASLVRGDPSSR